MRELTDLCLLAKKYETDKGGRHLRYGGGDSDTCHEYTPIYSDLLNDQRVSVKRVLEIGIDSGSSLRMWREYFPNALIYGVDSNQDCLFQEDRIVTAAADQGSAISLLRAVEWFHGAARTDTGDFKFDLIVDDGSHELSHQILSMQTLLPFLDSTGFYVIEDMTYDCRPELIGEHVPADYTWMALPTERGIGKAVHCGCRPDCPSPEQLLVIRHG